MITREQFLTYVEENENGCLLWTGSVDSTSGYGKLHTAELGYWLAHRLAYVLFVGPIPKGLKVLHKCDIRRCVNYEHLFLGTISDNAIDMVSKGRHWNQRLSNAEVEELRNLYYYEHLTTKQLSVRFGVSLRYTQRLVSFTRRLNETELAQGS